MKFSQGKNLKTAEKAVIVVILILAATIIFVVFAYYGQKEFRKTITFQTEQHLLTIARINAGRLQDLVSDLSGQLKIIAEEGAVQDEILKRSDFSVLHDYPIRIFYKSHQDVVDAFTALDCQGSVLYRQSFCKDNRGGRVGNDLTDKPGVAYVVEEHEPYTSEVFVNNSGQPAISISEPVFHKNEFIGIVRWMINLKNFTNRFIKPIQNSGEEKNSIYVIDRNGKILIHSDQEYIGHHVIPYNYDKSPDHCCSDLENIIGKMIKGREGTGSYYAPIHGAEGLSSGEKLIAYCPVRFLDNRLWSIGVSMNYERIAGPIYSHAVEHVSVTGLVMILLIAGGFIFYWMEKRKSEEFEKSNRELTKEAAERLKAEEALIRSETQKQAILDASVDMIMLVDRNMRIIWANKMAGLVVNKKPDDLIGHTCHKFFQNLDEPCPGCPCKKPFETGRIESAIMYQPAMDTVGESYWEDYGVPVKDETGKVTGVIEIARNVTEKVKTEKAVRESEQKFAGIVESVVDAMFMIDEQFNIVWTNDIAKDLFGEDMIGRKCHSVLHGDESICSQCLAKHCFQDGGVHDFETSITVRDHGWRTFWCTVSVASRHEDGRPKKVVESLRDITDRKNAKREIETLKRQIEFILGATKTGLDIIDSEFNIRYIDPEWRKVYGDPAGRKCYEYFMDRTEMCHDCKIPQALETKKVQTSEHLLIKEGRRPVLVSTLPFQNEEGDWLVAEVNADIKEIKLAEKELRASLAEKEVLLREIHHRVKNNMQVISSLLKLQSRHIEDRKAVDMLEESRDRIKSMALVHEKLYETEDLSNVDFREYIEDLLHMLLKSYGISKNIKMKVNVEKVMLKIDNAIPCGLIVNELIVNSLKYAFTDDREGEIKVTLHLFNENEMELAVSDNGPGMPEDFDFNNTASLGLKLVNILTEQLGGRLEIEREEGTKFKIIFKIQ